MEELPENALIIISCQRGAAHVFLARLAGAHSVYVTFAVGRFWSLHERA